MVEVQELEKKTLHVLLCDDDPSFLDEQRKNVAAVFQQMQISARIDAFPALEKITKSQFAGYDIAVLDIDFREKRYNGIDIARALRIFRRDAVIIFVTNFIEYAPEGYEVQAFRYLLKSELEGKLGQYLRQAVEQLRSLRKILEIQSGGEKLRLRLDEIIYIESQGHAAIAHAASGRSYSFYKPLSVLEAQLEEDGFLRVHKSFLVNMRHIRKYQCKEAVLSDGTVLRVSERSYAEKKRKYLLWKGRL